MHTPMPGTLEVNGVAAWFWRMLHRSYVGLSSQNLFSSDAIEAGGGICVTWAVIKVKAEKERKSKNTARSD